MIDGEDAGQAGLTLAGVVGLDPRFFSVADLWLMAEAKRRHDRLHAVEQAAMVWANLAEIDVERFIRFGEMREPPTIDEVMSPELAKLVDEENRKLIEEKRRRDGKPQ